VGEVELHYANDIIYFPVVLVCHDIISESMTISLGRECPKEIPKNSKIIRKNHIACQPKNPVKSRKLEDGISLVVREFGSPMLSYNQSTYHLEDRLPICEFK
jgi:hypothetical protein